MKKKTYLTRKFLVILTLFLLVSIIGIIVIIGNYEKDYNTSEILEKPEITEFLLKKSDNPQLKEDVYGVIMTNNQIIVVIDYEISNLMFKPTIEYHKDISITPDTYQKINAKEKTKYTVSNIKNSVEYEVVFDSISPLELKSIYVNGTPAYYNSKTKIYHVPIDKSKWGQPYIFEPIGMNIEETFVNGTKVVPGKATSISLTFGEEYELKVCRRDESKSLTFILSGLPIFSVTADYDVDNVPQKGRKRGAITVSVYDPTEDGQYSVENQYAGVRLRGTSASKKKKRPYSLEFQDKKTKKEVGVKLFGLRNDGDWILDAVATDVLRLRNRISTDIWNDMHTLAYIGSEPKARPATRGRMTELYFNDEYRGIYCVTERIDRKQLNLNKVNGYLYKAEGWDDFIKFESYNPNKLPKDGDKYWSGCQAECPNDPHTKWGPLVDLVKFVCDSDDITLAAGISERFDIDNLVDYFIFINVLGATDNSSKNTFIGIYNSEGVNPEDKRFFYAPWDLDGTFGRDYYTRKIDPGFVLGIEEWWADEDNRLNHLMLRLAKTNGGEFGTKVKKRWYEVKNSVCSKASILERFRNYQEELEGSGAYQRESKKWRDAEALDREIDYIDAWLETHLEFLDKYIQNWDSNVSKL